MKAKSVESMELRWFYSGVRPAGTERLFADHAGTPGPSIEKRTDLYLVSRDEAVGVKLRNGRLEVKSRCSTEKVDVGGVGGQLEAWVKWTWDGVDANFSVESPPNPWLAVTKVRYRCKFEIEGELLRLVGSRRVSHGGALEITELTVAGKNYWTAGAEAFAAGPEAKNVCLRGATMLVSRLSELSSTDGRSGGYPSWLILVKNASEPRL